MGFPSLKKKNQDKGPPVLQKGHRKVTWPDRPHPLKSFSEDTRAWYASSRHGALQSMVLVAEEDWNILLSSVHLNIR